MTSIKTITLTIGTFVCKMMSLLYNTLPGFVIAFLPKSKCLLISWLLVTLTKLKLNSSMKTYKTIYNTKKYALFITGAWTTKVGSQEIPGITDKFGLGVQNEAGQRLTEFCQENTLVIANTLFQQHKRRLYTWTSPDGQY